ncbi:MULTISPECIES: hypothetical protein [Fischerella]|uniref:hypothetical protein n=1 Tax=Fischerella TaxID=1190 RepID=UPI000A81FF7A|nr:MULTISPECIES: hypothetical protein [Fischerella]
MLKTKYLGTNARGLQWLVVSSFTPHTPPLRQAATRLHTPHTSPLGEVYTLLILPISPKDGYPT